MKMEVILSRMQAESETGIIDGIVTIHVLLSLIIGFIK